MKTENIVVFDIYSEYDFIYKIYLEDRVIITEEDTGGEDTCLEINGNGKLNIGDIISFEYEREEVSLYGKYLSGVTGIYINEKLYPCSVVSEGGNKDTYLVIRDYE